MKHLSYSLLLAAILAMQPTDASVILGYPSNIDGDGPVEMIEVGRTEKSGSYKVIVGPLYSFTFMGIETYGNVSGEPESDSGHANFKAIVKDNFSGNGNANEIQISFKSIDAFNTSPYQVLEITPYVTYRATDTEPLFMEFQFVSNLGGQGTPDGHFNILGETRAYPPIPTGSLFIPVGDYLLEGADPNPEVQATIVRD